MPASELSCPACGRANQPDNAFCGGCGAPLPLACPDCGRANPTDHSFCGGCGRRLGEDAAKSLSREPRAYTPRHLAEKILTTRSATEGERKHVTVLFADVADSTPLAEAAGPDEMHAIMDRCFRIILDEVHRYEGTVNQFLGDGVMALFGAPVALEGAGRRAVLAALGIERALAPLREDLRERLGVDFRMNVGIHSGQVVVGRIGDDLRMDYTAIGDTTNLASRLLGLAEPGAIVISAATERLVSGYFELRDIGLRAVKGKAEPVHVYQVLDERGVSGRLDAVAPSGLTPFIGREREIDTLVGAFESAREGRGQVVFLVGEAGIGKSRLLREFQQRIGGQAHGWLEGRCSAYGQDTPFHPIVDGLRRRFGIEPRDDDASALARIDRAQEQLGSDLDWTLPYMRQLLSLPPGDPAVEEMDPMARRAETARALQARFLRGSERQPIVMVIEDLHWIDAASEELLGFLTESVAASGLLLLFTHRPGYAHPFGDRSFHTRIPLQALSTAEMGDMVGSLLEHASFPAELRNLIAAKAEGNPFFVEEVTKSLIEEGIVRRENGRVMLARDPGEISVPDTLQDVLQARIDRLPDEPKRAIQIASVIGREFALRLLERAVQAGRDVTALVEELRALELVYEKSAHPELAYMFKHALTHDVAYESVLLERRRALHRVIGQAIEELYPDRLTEHYEALAKHFSAAEDWDNAFRYHELAAGKSANAYANHAAAEHCRQALAIAERLGDAVSADRLRRLQELRGETCAAVNDFAASGDAFAAAGELGDGPAHARNLGRAAMSYLWAHDYEVARSTATRGVALARAEDDPAAEALSLTVQDEQHVVEGGGLADDSLGRAALAAAERSGNAEALVAALTSLVQKEEMRGSFERAIPYGERAVEIARRERLARMGVMSQWFLGLARAGLGQYERALADFRSGLDTCERLGDRGMGSRLQNTLGFLYAELGCHERASEYNRSASGIAREIVELGLVAGAPELYANAAVNLAGNLIALGDVDSAREELQPIVDGLDEDDDPWMRWRYSLHVLDVLARADLARGDPERALARTEQELAGARNAGGARKIEARALELQGRALVLMDDREAATRVLDEALEVARAIGYPPVIWRALSLRAELMRRAGSGAAESLAAQARGLVTRLAEPLSEPEIRHQFGQLGERLVSDPLAAHR